MSFSRAVSQCFEFASGPRSSFFAAPDPGFGRIRIRLPTRVEFCLKIQIQHLSEKYNIFKKRVQGDLIRTDTVFCVKVGSGFLCVKIGSGFLYVKIGSGFFVCQNRIRVFCVSKSDPVFCVSKSDPIFF